MRHPHRSSPRRAEVICAIIWIGVIAGFAVYVAVGRVTTLRDVGLRGNARLWDIWYALADELPVPTFLWVILVLGFLGSAAWALWLALVTTDHRATTPRLRPPAWAIAALIPVALLFVTLGLWAAPRDDVTAEALMNQSGVEQMMMPTECAGFLSQAAVLRSGDLDAGQDERAAGFDCRTAIATIWPTRSADRPTGVALWATVEAAGR